MDNVTIKRTKKNAQVVRKDYVKRIRDNYLLILRALMHDLIVSIDKDGYLVFVNDAAVEFWGKPREKIVGTHFTEYLHPDDVEKTVDALQDLIEKKTQVKSFMMRVKSPMGFRTVAWTGVAVFDDEGNYVGAQATGKDLTNLLRAEDKLRESEERYRRLVENAPEAIYVNDLDGTFIDGNKRAEELTGYNRDELIGKNMFDLNLVPEKYFPQLMESIEANKRGEKTGPDELEMVKKDGSIIVIETVSIPVEREGKIEVIGVARDITERKKMENELKESLQKFKTIFECATDGILASDPETQKFVFANPRICELTGYSLDELLKLSVSDIHPEKDLPAIQDQFEKQLQRKIILAKDTPVLRKDNTIIYCDINSSPMKLGKKECLVGFFRDVTEQKKAEEALRRSKEKAKRLLEFQKKIIDTATVWINLTDLKGNVILWNRAAELISGYSHKEIIGHKKMWKWLYPDSNYRAKLFAVGKEIIETGKRLEDFESTIRCKDGSMKTISWYATTVLDEKGKPARSIAVGIDITEQKKAQKAIKEANRRLKKSNEALESYTYVVSHDLKAPLRTIKSFGSFILEDYKNKLDETGQDYLNRMVNAASRMDVMIEDLLVLSRVGRKFVEFEKVDLNKLLKEILADLEATIKERNVEVVVDKLPTLYVHKVWKRQLFMNLISNALKFNESETPKIEVLYEERENDHLFKVRDNGIGIEKKYLDRIFNLFERAPTEKKYEGTGAGLAICKKIAEYLGGKIWVESTPGKGSTFSFTIPKKLKQTEEM